MRRLLLLAAVALAAPPALAKAPPAPEQGSLDWILDRLKSDREEERTRPTGDPVEAKITAYQRGETPLEEWAPIVEIVRGVGTPPARPIQRVSAASALIDRLRTEGEKGTDARILRRVKKDMAMANNWALLKMMNVPALDTPSLNLIFRITQAFWPQSKVDWKIDDPQNKRQRDFGDMQKYILKQ